MQPDTDLRDTTLRVPTDLLDRWRWDERASHALALAGNRASALLLVKLDTADTTVLRTATTVLLEALRETDVAGHHEGHGGDEFLVFLPARDRQLGELIARRIRSRLRRAIIPRVVPTAIGIAITDPTTARRLSLPELVRQADAALLAATTHGDHTITAGTRP